MESIDFTCKKSIAKFHVFGLFIPKKQAKSEKTLCQAALPDFVGRILYRRNLSRLKLEFF
jgi:hypothetical protein